VGIHRSELITTGERINRGTPNYTIKNESKEIGNEEKIDEEMREIDATDEEILRRGSWSGYRLTTFTQLFEAIANKYCEAAAKAVLILER
jgi:hypothetical protein